MALNQRDNLAVFRDMSVPKAVMTMAIPTIISQLIVLIYNMADTFFIGRTGSPEMVAGASLVLPLFNISLSLSGLAGIGGGALISRLLGMDQKREARLVYSFSVYVALFASLLFSLLTLSFMHPMMNFLGASDRTYGFASSYAFFVIVIGGMPTVLSNTLATLIRSVGESKKAGFGITMGGLINIALDPLFMFVIFPKGNEIIGAAVATLISNTIACIYFIVSIKIMKSDVLRLSSPLRFPTRKSVLGIFGVGIPSSIATLLFDIDYMVIDRLMSGYGDVALAAVGIVLKVERLPLNIGIGICQGMMPIVAFNYASRNFERMNRVKWFSMVFGLITAAISILLYECFAPYIMRFFINDASTVEIGTRFLRIREIATPLMFLCFFHVYLFDGFGRGRYALFLGVMRWLCFNIPLLYILNSLIGMYGIVWTQSIADFFTVVLSLITYAVFSRKNFKSETKLESRVDALQTE